MPSQPTLESETSRASFSRYPQCGFLPESTSTRHTHTLKGDVGYVVPTHMSGNVEECGSCGSHDLLGWHSQMETLKPLWILEKDSWDFTFRIRRRLVATLGNLTNLICFASCGDYVFRKTGADTLRS